MSNKIIIGVPMIQDERVQVMNPATGKDWGFSVLLWLQAFVRASCNHTLGT